MPGPAAVGICPNSRPWGVHPMVWSLDIFRARRQSTSGSGPEGLGGGRLGHGLEVRRLGAGGEAEFVLVELLA